MADVSTTQQMNAAANRTSQKELVPSGTGWMVEKRPSAQELINATFAKLEAR